MAIIKEKGTIAVKCDVQTGVSAAGNNWARQTIVVDVEGYNDCHLSHPKSASLWIFGYSPLLLPIQWRIARRICRIILL